MNKITDEKFDELIIESIIAAAALFLGGILIFSKLMRK
jgi:hypothetical protein